MRVVMISDLHLGAPYMTLAHLDEIIARAQTLAPDLIALTGDLAPGPSLVRTRTPPLEAIASRLARLTAPQGVYAVLGNHDWWLDEAAQARQSGPIEIQEALEATGIPVLANQALALANGVWLAGLDSQEAIRIDHLTSIGKDDLEATLAQVPDGPDLILLAHEPHIFAEMPERVSLTLSGHTHGGQLRLFGWAPILPRTIDRSYVYGHITRGDQHLVVSAGLGYSKIPLRVGTPPEITVIDLQAERDENAPAR
ncbi:MAG: metallophosphoesterase [Pseudomonadota bacterium]